MKLITVLSYLRICLTCVSHSFTVVFPLFGLRALSLLCSLLFISVIPLYIYACVFLVLHTPSKYSIHRYSILSLLYFLFHSFPTFSLHNFVVLTLI